MKPLKILYACSELAPMVTSGGLGDVVGALAGVLSQLGHEVTCCIPFYRCARLRLDDQASARHAKPVGLTLSIPLGSRTVTGDVLELRQREAAEELRREGCDCFFAAGTEGGKIIEDAGYRVHILPEIGATTTVRFRSRWAVFRDASASLILNSCVVSRACRASTDASVSATAAAAASRRARATFERDSTWS